MYEQNVRKNYFFKKKIEKKLFKQYYGTTIFYYKFLKLY